ncbi:MAG: hypothetical protein ACYCQI_04505 [Gammaproteobacteria bacterium]
MCNWFLTGLGWFGSSAGGSLITYLFMRHRDLAFDKKSQRNKLVATCNSICFSLAMQISELGGLSKDIENRITQLQKVKEPGDTAREVRVAALQDFAFYKDLNVDMEKMSEVILFSGGDQRGVIEILQSTFLSNKKYFKIISTLERYNEAKRLMNNETTDPNTYIHNLLQFAEVNMPEYKKEIEQNMKFITQTLEAFKSTVSEKFNITVKISIGEVVKLN